MNSERPDWRKLHKGALEKLNYILSQSILTNVCIKIVFNEKVTEFKAHKLLLEISSEVFQLMFGTGFKEGKSNELKIEDIDPNIFSLLLKHIYGQKIIISSVEEAWELFIVADRYLVYDTRDLCLDFIKENLSPGNCVKFFESSEQFDLVELRQKCLQMFEERTAELVKTDSFLRASLSTIKSLLDLDSLNIREIDLFNSFQLWLKSISTEQGEQIKEAVLTDIVRKFSFLSMSAHEFHSGPGKCSLISGDQKYAIITNLTMPDQKVPLPDGFRATKRVAPQEIGNLVKRHKLESECSEGGIFTISSVLEKTLVDFSSSNFVLKVNKRCNLKDITIFTKSIVFPDRLESSHMTEQFYRIRSEHDFQIAKVAGEVKTERFKAELKSLILVPDNYYCVSIKSKNPGLCFVVHFNGTDRSENDVIFSMFPLLYS